MLSLIDHTYQTTDRLMLYPSWNKLWLADVPSTSLRVTHPKLVSSDVGISRGWKFEIPGQSRGLVNVIRKVIEQYHLVVCS